jgi:hypothetical protein
MQRQAANVFSMGEVIRRKLKFFFFDQRIRNIRVEIECQDGCLARGDRVQLHQVFRTQARFVDYCLHEFACIFLCRAAALSSPRIHRSLAREWYWTKVQYPMRTVFSKFGVFLLHGKNAWAKPSVLEGHSRQRRQRIRDSVGLSSSGVSRQIEVVSAVIFAESKRQIWEVSHDETSH